MAQQATLETRDAKHEPRSLAEQRAALACPGRRSLGGPRRGPCHGACTPFIHSRQDQPDHRRGLGRSDGGEGVGGGGGTPLHLADLACPRRSTTPSPRRQPPTDKVRAAGRPARRRGAQHQIDTRSPARRRHHSNRRRCGGPMARSVYTVAGQSCSPRPESLTPSGGSSPPRAAPTDAVVDAVAVDLALLESAANGDSPGRRAGRSGPFHGHLRCPAAAGDRPAGAGKTTALRALTQAWLDSGGQVLGLAPSAAAAAQLRDHTGAPATRWRSSPGPSNHSDLPDWAERIGRSTLVIDRRGRDGRHALPGHRRSVHHRPRRQRPAYR